MLWPFPSWVTLALIGALLMVGAAVAVRQSGINEGYDRRVAEQAAQERKAELERKNDDAKLQSMDDADLCREYLRSRGMPVDPCGTL